MRIKLDENIPAEAATSLRALGHEVDTVPAEGLGGKPDPEVWRAAQDARRFLVTQDLHFSDARQFPPGSHCGILLLRLGDASRAELASAIEKLFKEADVSTWIGSLVVATRRKTRVRRLI